MATKKRVKPSYDDQFRASAVLMLQSQGYPDVKGALTIVANHLHVPAMTLSRWFKGTQNPPPNQVVNNKRADFKTLFTDEIYAIMGVLPERRDDASYGSLVQAAGIFFDKIRLLDGLPTEIIAAMPILTKLGELFKAQGVSASDALQAYYDAITAETNVEQSVIGSEKQL